MKKIKYNKPKMIIFDYGNTLIYENELNLKKGYFKLYELISKNPNRVSREDFTRKGIHLIDKIVNRTTKNDVEFQHAIIFRTLFESLNIQFDLPLSEIEFIFWEAFAPCKVMPNIEKFLDFLNKKNIRTAVISNMSFSEKVLVRRINKYLPKNNFEFIMASGSYGFRKPESILFEIAVKKANLKPKEIYYCGDNLRADVLGSSLIGIKPVLFKHSEPCPYDNNSDINLAFDFLKISDWNQMVKLLSN